MISFNDINLELLKLINDKNINNIIFKQNPKDKNNDLDFNLFKNFYNIKKISFINKKLDDLKYYKVNMNYFTYSIEFFKLNDIIKTILSNIPNCCFYKFFDFNDLNIIYNY